MAFNAIALETRIYTLLKAAVTAGVEVYHLLPPDNAAVPYVLFTRIATAFDNTLVNQSQFIVALIQVDCWHNSDTGAAQEAGKCRLALAGVREGAGVNIVSGAICDSEFSSYEEQSKLYRRSLTFKVMMREDPT